MDLFLGSPRKHESRTPKWALPPLVLWLTVLALAVAEGYAESKEPLSPAPARDAQSIVAHTTGALLAAFKYDQALIRRDATHAYAIVDKVLSPHVDYDRVTQLILGKYWRQASPGQRQRFMDEFRALQIRTYATALLDHTDTHIRYLPTRPSEHADRTIVRTQLPRRDGTLISVDYRLHQVQGIWKVYDVLVEGVSLLTSYRATIGAQIAQLGIEGVIEQLSAKNRQPGSSVR